MSDLMKLVLTSYDAHLSHHAAFRGPTRILIRSGIIRSSQYGEFERGLTGRETVTAGVALQFLFAVFTVEVIFTGGAEVHWKRERERERGKQLKHAARTSGYNRSHLPHSSTALAEEVKHTYRTRWRGAAREC